MATKNTTIFLFVMQFCTKLINILLFKSSDIMTYIEFDKSMESNNGLTSNTTRRKCFCDDVLEINICQHVTRYDLMK